MKKICLLMSIVLFLAMFSLSAAEAGSLSGRIYEKGTNAGIRELTVKLIPSKDVNEPDRITTTDINGVFQFSNLREDRYLLEVYQGLTLLYRDTIHVEKNKQKNISLKRK